MTNERKTETALVLAGGGTRGAYEAGVIHYIRTKLPPDIARRFQFDIHCGSSVGAINAAWMAATAEDLVFQGNDLMQRWLAVRTENIYRTGPVSLGKLLLRSIIGITAHFLGIEGWKEKGDRSLHFQGLFDTQPFFLFLRQGCHWPNITKNLEAGRIDGVCVSATNMHTGQVELFVQKRPDVQHSERMPTHQVKLSPRHVMASAAIPILFPPVPIEDVYYNDGGLRLNTPLAPAVSLGAGRILMIGTHFRRGGRMTDTQGRFVAPRYPTLAEILGRVLQSILTDRLQSDSEQVERINRVLRAIEKNTSPEIYSQVCREASVRQIEELVIMPSVDIATLVDETVRGSLKNLRTFSSLERAILRILEAGPGSGSDFLSYFLFEPSYLKKLVDLGYEDAHAQHDEIAAFAERSIRRLPID